jgi:hypothetical protein
MFTAYKLWYVFLDLKHWVMSCPWKHMIRLDNVSTLVNQSYCLGRPVPERPNLHRLRSIASSKMLEGTPNLSLAGSSQMLNPTPLYR